jgi:CheY-like chemotaxis protein
MHIKNVFLIDDDSDDREIFRSALESISVDYKLTEAVDGQHALELIKDASFSVPDIIFLDLNMPRLGGLDVLKKLRATENYKEAEVFMYTTSSMQHDKDNCFNAGATGFITKHYDFESLCGALKTTFGV